MVRNGDIVEAHVWSASAQEWSNVGQVVDAPGSVSKRVFEGKEYDFVFDVDIQEGAPPLKLPYNASENPFDAARRFLENNELPISYLDTVGNFIVQNSQGVSLGQSSEPADTVPDPFGIENRYRPGETNQPLPPPTHSKLLPQKEYLTITAGNLALAEKKIRQVNDELLQNGQEVHSLNPEEVKSLGSLCTFLQPNVSSSTSMQPLPESCLEILSKLVRDWPPQDRLPALDLLRLVAGTSPLVAKMNLVELFSSSGTFSKEHPNNVMLAVRAFVNIFQTDEGKKYVLDYFNEVCSVFENI
jgi:phospholipase A-2-activating protein